jgi:hypothetical protein
MRLQPASSAAMRKFTRCNWRLRARRKEARDATAGEMASDTRQAVLFSDRFPTRHVASRLASRLVDAGEASVALQCIEFATGQLLSVGCPILHSDRELTKIRFDTGLQTLRPMCFQRILK